MDWNRAVERNQEALSAIIAALVVLVGAAADRVPRGFYRSVIRVLGPAEAAVRRLIVIAARGLVAEPVKSRTLPKLPASRARSDRMAFRLFDPRKYFGPRHEKKRPRFEPRIHVFGPDPRLAMFRPVAPPEAAPPSAQDDGLADTRRLRLRLEAVAHALGDLPRQAKRLVRWRARRAQIPSLKYRSPLRPGPPPGHRKKPIHQVDFVLTECHGLAWDVLTPDTS